MDICIKKLTSGYTLIKGIGPENWWQGERYPCPPDELDLGFAAECCNDFTAAVHADNRERRYEASLDYYD